MNKVSIVVVDSDNRTSLSPFVQEFLYCFFGILDLLYPSKIRRSILTASKEKKRERKRQYLAGVLSQLGETRAVKELSESCSEKSCKAKDFGM